MASPGPIVTISARPPCRHTYGVTHADRGCPLFPPTSRFRRHASFPVFVSYAAMNGCFSLSLTITSSRPASTGELPVPKSR